MNYISREKFLAQPMEVQNSMKEWYKEYFKNGNDFALINYNSVDTCYHTLVALNENFNIDEFINRDTEEALLKAQNATSGKDTSTLEDYVDSVCLGMGIKEEDVKKLSIRKFWRYVKRISKRDVFNVMKTAETSGMVKLKEPVEYWMSDIEINDKYKEVKTDTQSLQKMISG